MVWRVGAYHTYDMIILVLGRVVREWCGGQEKEGDSAFSDGTKKMARLLLARGSRPFELRVFSAA